jgi:small-conductance mechanosensitive channel
MNVESILNFQILHNNVESWITAVMIALVIILLGKTTQYFLSAWFKEWAKKTKTSVDDFIVSTLEKIKWEWVVIGIFAATRYLDFSKSFDVWMLWLFALVMLYRIIRIVNSFMDYITAKVYLEQEAVDSGSKGAIKHIVFILKIGVTGVLIVIALDNLGFHISAVIAGLGVTGIIIGLAVQNIVGDLFSSFCIIFDKPFEVGDFIIVGDFMGAVENIGIKTTRLTSLGGEQLVFSNSDLTGSRIRNYKRMAKRRIVFSFGVEYGTEEEKLKSIPAAVKAIISDIEDTTYDRAHFQKFGDSGLYFEVVYYVLSSDYNKYMNIQERINFEIFSKFNKEGINFAFPTRTLHVKECNVIQESRTPTGLGA